MSRIRKERREFLKNAAKSVAVLGLGPTAIETLLSSFLNRAEAQVLHEKFYVHLSLPQGPPRWFFDLPTNPGGVAGDFMAGGFGTAIDASGDIAKAVMSSMSYTANGKTYKLPPIWGQGPSGRAYTSILANTTFIRGMDMEINNHAISNQRQVAPIIGGKSITGALADVSKMPMPGIIDNGSAASQVFRSGRGLAPSALARPTASAPNPLISFLSSFKPLASTSPVSGPAWEQAIKQSLNEFDKYIDDHELKKSSLADAYEQANELIKSNTYDLTNKWATVFPKYEALVKEAFNRERINQLFNQPVKADGSKAFSIDGPSSQIFLSSTDLRTMFNAETTAPFMASNFAIAEILLTSKVTSNATLGFGSPTGFQLGSTAFAVTHDQHRIGSVVTLLSHTAFYRALLNCLHEFIAVLKHNNMFNDTVIHIAAEFNRTPRADGSGSDHGFYGANATLISGMIQKFAVIGNVYADGRLGAGDSYAGTWGRAAPFRISSSETRAILPQDVALTACAMLGAAPVSANGYNLLNGNAGWAPVRSDALNVKG